MAMRTCSGRALRRGDCPSRVDDTADERLTGLALRVILSEHLAIPREGQPDLLTDAEQAFVPLSSGEAIDAAIYIHRTAMYKASTYGFRQGSCCGFNHSAGTRHPCRRRKLRLRHHQAVAELSGGHLQWTDGMLYPVLHRLERQGYVAAKWDASESGRKRKYYRITEEGRAQLAAQRQHWNAVDDTLRGIWMRECTV